MRALCIVLLLIAGAEVAAGADSAAAQTQSQARYAGRALADVLRELQTGGLKIVFSSTLVAADARVLVEPRAQTPRRVLDEILRPHGLEVRDGAAGTLLVVRAERASDRQRPSSAPAETGGVGGRVVDARTGAPVPGVTVMVQDSGHETQTDADGGFALSGVPVGPHDLFVSTLGYSLARPAVDVRPNATTTLTIPLAEGTGAYTDRVTVTAERVAVADQAIPSQQVVGSAALQSVGSVLIDDPFRAVQSLPGVVSNDDFRSDISVRGIDFAHLGLSIDGIQTRLLLHTFEEISDSGSMALFNSDILERMTLSVGSYPQRYGDRSGAWLDATMREGSRAARSVRGAVSGTAASFLAEGPLGAARGSWLVATRYSYIDWLVRRVVDDFDSVFGFADVQTKTVYDLTPRHRIEFLGIAGRARLDQPEETGLNDIDNAADDMGLASVALRSTVGDKLLLTQRLWGSGQRFSNVNPAGTEIGRGRTRDFSYRSDALWTPRPGMTLEGGAQALYQQSSKNLIQYVQIAPTVVISRPTHDFDADAVITSGFVHGAFGIGQFSIAPGVRVAHSTLVHQTTASPWIQGSWAVSDDLSLRAGVGLYHQFPEFTEVLGFNAGSDLGAERARHADVTLEHRLGSRTRWQLTLFQRSEADVLDLDDDYRLVNGRPGGGPLGATYGNDLDGRAHGVEALVQRQRGSGVSGWLSYTWSHTTRRDTVTGERFDADADQRHTVNLYGEYALSSRSSVSSKLRVGSNFPMPGYWQQSNGLLFLGERRNEVRLPPYVRLDVRANHVFNYTKRRLTLFVEVMNLLGRANARWNSPSLFLPRGQAFDYTQELFPRLPSAGLLIEF